MSSSLLGEKAANAYGTMQDNGTSVINLVEEDFEEIPHVVDKRQDHTTTDFSTFIHILKGNIGPALLALPLAVRNAGVIIGPIGLLLMGIIATHCMMLLLDSARHLCKKKKLPCLNYAEIAAITMKEFTRAPWLITAASVVVNIFLMITQFGFCSVYFVFMADSLDQVFCMAFDVHLGRRIWMAIFFLPVLICSWIRNLKELSNLSLIANICILFCLAVIFGEEIYSFTIPAGDSIRADERAAILKNTEEFEPFSHVTVKTSALFFGSAVFAVEGIGVVLPLENKMRNPSHAKTVFCLGMMIVVLLFVSFGTMGFLVYGDDIKASITLNLQSKSHLWASIIFVIVRIFYAYATFASFMLQFYVPMDFLEPPFFRLVKADKFPYYFPRHHGTLKHLLQLCFRTAFVAMTFVFALAVPDLGDLMSLIGAVASSALALILPATLELMAFWHERRERLFLWCLPWPVWFTKDALIILLGVVGMLLGSYASIANIIANMNSKGEPCEPLYYR